MKLSEYESVVEETNNYAEHFCETLMMAVALAGEVGEFCNKLKKVGHDYQWQNAQAQMIPELVDELGDVLWYVAAMARQCNVTMSGLMEMNARKLLERKKNKTIYKTMEEKIG